MPVIDVSNSKAKCAGAPTPAVPIVNLLGCALAMANKSSRVLMGEEGLTHTTTDTDVTKLIGEKSFKGA